MPINCRRPIYCRRQYQPIDMFWSIVQAMSIVVASPTSIVQDNNYKRTTFIGPLFKPCILRLLPRRPLFRTIAMDVVGLLFKPCTLWCMKRSTSCSEARGRGGGRIAAEQRTGGSPNEPDGFDFCCFQNRIRWFFSGTRQVEEVSTPIA